MQLHEPKSSSLKVWFAADHKLNYVGPALLLAWHFCIWYVPESFNGASVIENHTTYYWMVKLAATAITLTALPFILGRKRQLPESPAFVWVLAAVATLGTGYLTTLTIPEEVLAAISKAQVAGADIAMTANIDWIGYFICVLIGIVDALIWVLWGRTLLRARATFSTFAVLPVYGGCLLMSILIAKFAPWGIPHVFVSLLPLASSLLLYLTMQSTKDLPNPHLLPKEVAKNGYKAVVTVCAISAVAALALYFTVAIIPMTNVWAHEQALTWGVMIGAAAVLIFSAIGSRFRSLTNIFQVFPWLLVIAVITCVLYLLDMNLNSVAFLLALAISSMLEILIVIYTSVLPLKGFTRAVVAFGLGGGSIRGGILLGYGLAFLYIDVLDVPSSTIRITFLVLIVILTGLSIILVRQEYTINDLVRSPESASEQDVLIEQISSEFRLSERETEIVAYLARGYNAVAIAEKLTISTSTVSTHVQHIYEKMGIHKRAELISYLNKRA